MSAPFPLNELPGKMEESIALLDTALGRPPFPNPADPQVVALAREVGVLTALAKEKSRVQTLAKLQGVTTTLPILCAALKEGSVDHTPCPVLCETLLDAFVPVCGFSTFPLQNILKDMEAALPPHSTALFNFTVASGALTPEKMCQLLGLSVSCGVSAGGGGKGKCKGKATTAAIAGKGGEPSPTSSTSASPPQPRQLSKQLLRGMLSASLDKPCRELLLSTFNTSGKFLKLVGEDVELAQLILSVYGQVLRSTLTPSSLLPCLDEHLLNNFVDLVEKRSDYSFIQPDSGGCADPAVKRWSNERLRSLCAAVNARVATVEDGQGSLQVCVFFAQLLSSRKASVEKALLATSLQHLWSAAFRAAACVVTRQMTEETKGPSQRKGQANSLTAETSIELAGNNVLQVSGREEKWLRPLALLSEASLDAAVDLYFSDCASNEGETADQQQRVNSFRASGIVKAFSAEVLAASLLGKTPDRRHSPVQNTRQPLPPKKKQGTATASASPSPKQMKGNGQPQQQQQRVKEPLVADETLTPMPFVTYLQLSAQATLLCSLLVNETQASLANAQALAQAFQFCDAFPNQQQMAGAVWDALVDNLALAGWHFLFYHSGTASAAAAAPVPTYHEGFVSATRAVSNALWVAPYAMAALRYVQENDEGQPEAQEGENASADNWPDRFFKQPLLDTLLSTLLMKRTGTSTASTTATTGKLSGSSSRLYPLSSPVVLGLVAQVTSAEQLESALKRFTKDDAINAMLPYLDSLLEAFLKDKGETPKMNSLTSEWSATSIQGIQRLRERLSVEHALRQNDLQRKREAEAEQRKTLVLEKIAREVALANERIIFEKQQGAKDALKQIETGLVREEYERRAAAREALKKAELQLRAAKQREAAATLRAHQTLSREQREVERVARVARYRERMASLFRVSVFLEHLQLVPSRVMEIRNALSGVLDSISPDQLLEYVVNKTTTIPADMADEEEQAERPEESRTAPEGKGAGAAPAVVVTDFWADVARAGGQERQAATGTATAVARATVVVGGQAKGEMVGVRVPVSSVDRAHAHTQRRQQQQQPPSSLAAIATSVASSHSFHYCVAPLLNLFCFAGGNEYGDLPEPLPSLKLQLAAKVLPKVWVEAHTGYTTVREGFMALAARGLVTEHGSRVRLTVLGFRYHFPFHDPTGMLEVRIQRNRERIREAIALYRIDHPEEEESEEGEAQDNSGDAASASDESSDYDDVDDAEEEEEEDVGDRILPDVEFGI